MNKKMNKDLVYLVWTDVNTGKKYKVAELYKENEKYYFRKCRGS